MPLPGGMRSPCHRQVRGNGDTHFLEGDLHLYSPSYNPRSALTRHVINSRPDSSKLKMVLEQVLELMILVDGTNVLAVIVSGVS